MSRQLDQVVAVAVEQGLLTVAATESEARSRPWPVIVMTAVAAWFAAIPLGVMIALTFLTGESGPTVALALALPILIGAVALLRSRPALFLEQLAIAGLLIGVGLAGFGVSESSRSAASFIAMTLLTFTLAYYVPQNWLRMLLGAGGAWVAAEAVKNLIYHLGMFSLTLATLWQLFAVCWLAGHVVLARCEREPEKLPLAAVLEAVLSGAGTMIVLMLAYSAGHTFLISAELPRHFWRVVSTYDSGAMLSVAFGSAACAWIAKRWPAMRGFWFLATATVAALLCWLSEPMGAVLLVLAYSITSGRRHLAVLAGAAVLWIVGATYYQMAWPLVYKGLLLLGCGVALGAVARFALPAACVPNAAPSALLAAALPSRTMPWSGRLIAASGMLVLLLGNVVIWQKESIIRSGQPVFVELAPADPRSLMQGDYMRLNFAVPTELWKDDRRRLLVVARRDPNGVTKLLAPHTGKPLGADELLIEVVQKNGGWTVATDAWYFAEGEAARWASARYGEFRVDAAGRALLVDLRGENLGAL